VQYVDEIPVDVLTPKHQKKLVQAFKDARKDTLEAYASMKSFSVIDGRGCHSNEVMLLYINRPHTVHEAATSFQASADTIPNAL
jgi:hypothetical protein